MRSANLDGDTGQVGPELAEKLGIPFIAYVSKIEEIANGKMRVQRMVEDGYETIEASLPAVITVVKEINVPRMPSLRGHSNQNQRKFPSGRQMTSPRTKKPSAKPVPAPGLSKFFIRREYNTPKCSKANRQSR